MYICTESENYNLCQKVALNIIMYLLVNGYDIRCKTVGDTIVICSRVQIESSDFDAELSIGISDLHMHIDLKPLVQYPMADQRLRALEYINSYNRSYYKAFLDLDGELVVRADIEYPDSISSAERFEEVVRRMTDSALNQMMEAFAGSQWNAPMADLDIPAPYPAL